MTGTTPGVYVIKVKNSDGKESNGADLTINAPPTPTPQIININPLQTTAGTFDLTINGNNFNSAPEVEVYWKTDGHLVGHGTIKTKSASQIVVTESMTGTTPGVYVIKVKNSDGKESNGADLTINAPTSVATI
jgi:IPT/TIG domain